MSNNLKFDFDKPLGTQNNPKESDNLVIQCQYCETRYSIPSVSVTNSACSKFHCFSCDNIFEVELVNKSEPVQMPTQQVGFNFNSNLKPSATLSSTTTQKQQTATQNLSFQTPVTVAPVATKHSFGFNSSLKVTSEPLVAVRTKKEETSVAEKMNFAINNKPADLSARTLDTGTPRKSFVFTEFQKSISTKPELQIPETKSTSSWKVDSQLPRSNSASLSVKEMVAKLSLPKIDSKKFTYRLPDLSFPKMALPSFSVPRMSTAQLGRFSLGRTNFTSLTKLVMLVAPILFVLMLLYLLTTIILTSPQSFSGYFGFATPSSRSYPLPGVGVKGLELKLVKLDNGENLQLLTGEFYNNSSKSINNPVIEGLLFDTKGQVLSRSLHTLDEDLSNVQYASLDRKTLTELPNSKEKDKFVLLPNQKQSFSFALSADSEVQPTYYAGRVYTHG